MVFPAAFDGATTEAASGGIVGDRRVTISVRVPEGVAAFRLAVYLEPGSPLALRCRTVHAGQWRPLMDAWLRDRTNAQDDAGHDAWMRAHQPDATECARQRDVCSAWDNAPLVSIVTPVFKTPEPYLREFLDSILAQTYERFELVLVNASGSCTSVDRVLAACDDARVRVIEVENAGIAANTNVGIADARGDFVGFVDHDDFIEPDALFRYVETIHAHPTCDLLFCDEDLWGEADGRPHFYGARFKPSWDPDLLLTHNYACHMLMVSRRALDLTVRSGDEVNAAQDYDLTLKVAEVAREICHVPRVLYHWREHPGSTAENRESKPYALEAGRLAVQAHLDRIGVRAEVVEGTFPFSYRVRYKLPDPRPSVSAVVDVTSYDMLDWRAGLARLMASLGTLDGAGGLEVVLVCCVGQAEEAHVIAHEAAPECFGALRSIEVVGKTGACVSAASALDAGIRAATCAYVLLLDATCEIVASDLLAELMGPLQREDVGCTGPLLLDPDDIVQASGLIARPDGSFGHAERMLTRRDIGYMTMLLHARGCCALPAAGLMLRRQDYEELEGLDEVCGALAVQDLCLRLRERGLRCVVQPYAPLRLWGSHLPDVDAASAKDHAALLARHPDLVRGDPCLNPWLDPRCDLFQLSKES